MSNITVMQTQLRQRNPVDTLKWIRPLAKKIGISRIADVTWLDSIGLYVFQAFRPYSKNLVVSQGKGLTPEDAEISAIMESIEFYHAENVNIVLIDKLRNVKSGLSYDVDQLTKITDLPVPLDLPLRWTKAINLITGREELFPFDALSLNFEINNQLFISFFRKTSNGLASGNSKEESILHGLYEVIERDCLTCSKEVPVSLQEICGVEPLIQLVKNADIDIKISFLPNKLDIPCFKAYIKQNNQSIIFSGSAAHSNKEIALAKAIMEAVQSRLTLITGTRDDILKESYEKINQMVDHEEFKTNNQEAIQFCKIPSFQFMSLNEEYNWLLNRIKDKTGSEPLAIDLTKEELQIPVYFSVIPGFKFKVRH